MSAAEVYDPDTVALIRSEVPPFARRYDKQLKRWMVESGFIETLVAALEKSGLTVVWTGKPTASRRQGGEGWASALFVAVGDQRTDVVFRALARCLHPDTPMGDTSLMRDLIEARDKAKAGGS